MEALLRDLTFAVRTLSKNTAFAVVAILSLALGIGATTAIFSVTYALLLRPLPYKDADRLVILWSRSPGLNVPQDWFSPGQYLDIKTQNQVFDETAIAIGGSFNLTGRGAPEHVDGARVSSSLFSLMGAGPLLGRVFLADDDAPGKSSSVILSYGFWQRFFGAQRDVIGQTLTLNGNDFGIVGVMPSGFALNKEVMPAVNGIQNADLLVPLPLSESARTNRGNEDFNIFARLKPGISIAQAQADMDIIADRMKIQYPANYPPAGGLTISVVPLLRQVVGDVRVALYVLFGAVTFVLLIACANVASLLLARATVRRREIAIRVAVGASGLRITRQLLTESTLLGLIGGVAGLGIALAAVKVLQRIGSESIPRLNEVGVDAWVLTFTGLISLGTGIIFGLLPALRAARVDLNEDLKESGRSGPAASGPGQHRTRRLLVVTEVALSFLLLIGAGLLVRSYQRVTAANPGFDPHNVLSMRIPLPAVKYSKQESTVAFYKRLTERLKASPGVESAAVSYSLPMSTVALAWEPIKIEGYVPKNEQDSIISNVRIVSPEYFQTMRISTVRGRLFDERDTQGQPEIVVINEALAERFWPGQDPIGKRLQRGSSTGWRTVVGVIRDTKEYSAEKEPPIAVYFPFEQYVARNMFLLVRTESDPVSMTQQVTEEIRSLDAELPVFDVASMDQRLADSLARRRFAMYLLSVFAAVALTLAAIGIYGMMNYSVNQRIHEFGIRLALGAQPGSIRQLVIREALVTSVTGIAAGVCGALALTRVMSSLLYGVSHTDGWTFVITPLVLGSVALVAGYLPARRAAKVDPMIALRHE